MSGIFTVPEPGRHVHYFADVFSDPLAAIVTDVTGWKRGINEQVYVTLFLPRGGFQYRELPLCQPYDRIPRTEFLTWMPHTIKKMKEKEKRDNEILEDVNQAFREAFADWGKFVQPPTFMPKPAAKAPVQGTVKPENAYKIPDSWFFQHKIPDSWFFQRPKPSPPAPVKFPLGWDYVSGLSEPKKTNKRRAGDDK